MKTILIIVLFLITGLSALFLVFSQPKGGFLTPLVGSPVSTPGVETEKTKDLPLNRYTFTNLAVRDILDSEIVTEKVIKQEEGYASYLFSYQVEGKKVTGMLNLPDILAGQVRKKNGGFEILPSNKKLPVVVMLRGYADDDVYFTGLGTRKAAGVLAENGFITLAPDFLGFGGSDSSPVDILEARFQRPLTVLALLKAMETFTPVDSSRVFLWGHSNGGQIALSVLEITQRNLPTVLWAPVTSGFPECVLYYMGELDDQGTKVKAAIDQFEKDYQGVDFSVDAHFDLINAPIQIHQGGSDPLIPKKWTNDFLGQMNKLGKEVDYHTYPRADHNLVPDWDEVMGETVAFFKSFLPIDSNE